MFPRVGTCLNSIQDTRHFPSLGHYIGDFYSFTQALPWGKEPYVGVPREPAPPLPLGHIECSVGMDMPGGPPHPPLPPRSQQAASSI